MRGRSDGAAVARDYLEALQHQRRLAPATLENYAHALQLLLGFVDKRSLADLEAADIRRFLAILHAKGLAPRTLALTLSAWRGCFRWLVKHRGWRANPVLGIRAPKAPRALPKALSVEAAQRLLAAAPADDPLLVQDLAMFELLYSSGLRLAELVALDLGDGRLDLRQGEVTVTGKGSKSRTVPVGEKARQALRGWIDLRSQRASPGEKALFIGARGRRIAPARVWRCCSPHPSCSVRRPIIHVHGAAN